MKEKGKCSCPTGRAEQKSKGWKQQRDVEGDLQKTNGKPREQTNSG